MCKKKKKENNTRTELRSYSTFYTGIWSGLLGIIPSWLLRNDGALR